MNHVVHSEFRCDIIIFVVILLPSRQKLIELPGRRLVTCIFQTSDMQIHRLQIITLDKLIKKERLKRFYRFKDQNTLDSIYPVHINQYVG